MLENNRKIVQCKACSDHLTKTELDGSFNRHTMQEIAYHYTHDCSAKRKVRAYEKRGVVPYRLITVEIINGVEYEVSSFAGGQ